MTSACNTAHEVAQNRFADLRPFRTPRYPINVPEAGTDSHHNLTPKFANECQGQATPNVPTTPASNPHRQSSR
jgi:hypothetical protein